MNKKWEVAESGHCTPAVSLPVLRAVLCTALLWSWPRFAAITMIALAGMLHPAEFIPLERSDLTLPRDTCYTTKALYVHLKNPKTARFARQQHVKTLPRDTCYTTKALYVHLKNPKTARFARQQHVKISDPDIIFFVDTLFADLSLSQKIFGASISAYRNQWNAIMKTLGVPFRQRKKGITPWTLRGSGATQLYLMTENIPLISWRGRWARVRTLEFYLQEVAAQVLLHSLSPKSRTLIQKLSDACQGVLRLYVHEESNRACGAGSIWLQLHLGGLVHPTSGWVPVPLKLMKSACFGRLPAFNTKARAALSWTREK